MAALRLEKAGIAERLPQLDRSKKAASKGRNFKEAGALSKEMKQLEQRRSEVEAEMDELIPRLAELEDAQAATLANSAAFSYFRCFRTWRRQAADLQPTPACFK